MIVFLGVLASLTTVEVRLVSAAVPTSMAAVPGAVTPSLGSYEYFGPPHLFTPKPRPKPKPAVHPLDPEDDPFDWIALCESSGNADLDTGNGFYGAFQFALPTWRSLGRTGKPNEHTYEEQKQAAIELQKRSGWGQWPACSRKYGLVRD